MIEHLTTETFKEKVYDFEKNSDFKFEGERPMVIDFYAEWCGPCKTISPILEELSLKYDGKIDIYKVNVEDEPDISSLYKIRNIPAILFIPLDGDPQMKMGALTKVAFEDVFKTTLKVN